MKVFSTNPLVKDSVDKAFCLAREHFNVKNDETIFGETVVICYLDGYQQEPEYLVGAIGMTLSAKKITSKDAVKRSSDLVANLLNRKSMETVDFFSTDSGGKVSAFTWIAFKITGFSFDLERKFVKFDLLRLVANIVRVFSHHKIVDKESSLFGKDLQIIYNKLKELLMLTGTFKRIAREWMPREET